MRATKDVFIEDDNRDKGKVFKITEMPAMQAEKWAVKVFLALAKAGIDIPDDIAKRGLAGVAVVGIKMLGGVAFADAEPLMDEMFKCVQIYPDYHKNSLLVRNLVGQDDIEEIKTITRLRQEVLELHLGFTIAEGASKLNSGNLTTSATTE